jgi:hypothetical protein
MSATKPSMMSIRRPTLPPAASTAFSGSEPAPGFSRTITEITREAAPGIAAVLGEPWINALNSRARSRSNVAI